MKVAELLKNKAEKVAEARSMIELARKENRTMTEDEERKMETCKTEIENISKELEKIQKMQETERQLATMAANAGEHENTVVTFPNADERMSFNGLGEFLQSVAEFGKSNRNLDPRLKYQEDKRSAELRANGMNVTTPQDGGFFLGQPKLINELFSNQENTVYRDIVMSTRQYRDDGSGVEIPVINETSRAEGYRGGALKAYRKAEAATMTVATAKLQSEIIHPSEMFFLLPVTNRLLRNAPALVSQVQNMVVPEMYHRSAYEIFRGSGAGECKGILNDSNCCISIAKETGQKAGTVVWDNILKMESQLDISSGMNAAYYCNQFLPMRELAKISVAIGTAGELVKIFVPNQFGPGKDGLNNRPLIKTEFLPSPGTSGDLVLADLKKYAMIFDPAVSAEASIHVYYLTNESAFRWVWVVNGQPIEKAKTSESDSNTQVASFIKLASR